MGGTQTEMAIPLPLYLYPCLSCLCPNRLPVAVAVADVAAVTFAVNQLSFKRNDASSLHINWIIYV